MLYEFCLSYSCGGFNTPTLCVVTKGIKSDCNHLMRTTYPDALRQGMLIAYYAIAVSLFPAHSRFFMG